MNAKTNEVAFVTGYLPQRCYRLGSARGLNSCSTCKGLLRSRRKQKCTSIRHSAPQFTLRSLLCIALRRQCVGSGVVRQVRKRLAGPCRQLTPVICHNEHVPKHVTSATQTQSAAKATGFAGQWAKRFAWGFAWTTQLAKGAKPKLRCTFRAISGHFVQELVLDTFLNGLTHCTGHIWQTEPQFTLSSSACMNVYSVTIRLPVVQSQDILFA